MFKFKSVELCSEHVCTGTYPIEPEGSVLQALVFFLKDLRVQLDDSTHLNSELKEQVAMAERHNSLLKSELEELRSLQEQTERGRRLAEEELLEATERINLFHTQVGPINSPAASAGRKQWFPYMVSLGPYTAALSNLG